MTTTLKLVDTTQTSSFDDWAQGFRSDGVPNMNCPGQSTSDLFYFSLMNQPNYLDLYNQQHATAGAFNASATGTTLPYQLAVQVLRRHAQLEPAAARALRRHVLVPERSGPRPRNRQHHRHQLHHLHQGS